MVGMDVRLQRVHETELELAQERHVPIHVLAHGIDEDGLPRPLVGQQMGVGRGLRVEELTEDHDSSSAAALRPETLLRAGPPG